MNKKIIIICATFIIVLLLIYIIGFVSNSNSSMEEEKINSGGEKFKEIKNNKISIKDNGKLTDEELINDLKHYFSNNSTVTSIDIFLKVNSKNECDYYYFKDNLENIYELSKCDEAINIIDIYEEKPSEISGATYKSIIEGNPSIN